MTVEEMNEVIDKQIKRCSERSMEVSDAVYIEQLSYAIVRLMEFEYRINNLQKEETP